VWFVQQRLGRGGRPFLLLKFATHATIAGPTVTTTRDRRVDPFGRWLRRFRLDELPQLLNVLRGDMALVGPRPEVPANLTSTAADDLAALQLVRPGLTGLTQLGYAAEDEVLASQRDPVAVYRQLLVPWKVRLDRRLLARRTWLGDLRVLFLTPFLLGSKIARRRSSARVLRRLVRPRTAHTSPGTECAPEVANL